MYLNLLKKKKDNEHFQLFLKYFEDNYLKKYEINYWNYYNNIENTTNNFCESHNNKLNNYFQKMTFLYVLREN